jgi:hypothetical protein
MNKILSSLILATVLASTSALAEDTLRVSLQDGKQRIDFSLNGNGKCVMIDDKITCQPVQQPRVRVASSKSK